MQSVKYKVSNKKFSRRDTSNVPTQNYLEMGISSGERFQIVKQTCRKIIEQA